MTYTVTFIRANKHSSVVIKAYATVKARSKNRAIMDALAEINAALPFDEFTDTGWYEDDTQVDAHDI